MKYKAKIANVEKHEDELIIDVEFFNGKKSFTKRYPFVHMVDINNNFDQTVKNEIKRINDLEAGYLVLKSKINKEITVDEETTE